MNSLFKYNFLLVSLILWTSCKQESASEGEYKIYDPGKMQVITTVLNPELHSMAILYGNSLAYNAALEGEGNHVKGEEYTFVTWNFRESPRWFGSNINEDLISVEKLRVIKDQNGFIDFNYAIELGTPLPVGGRQLSTKDRIAYLLDYHPAVLP